MQDLNYIDYLIERAKRDVPDEILGRAFSPTNQRGMYSLEDRIYQDVLMDIVYRDFSLIGGTEQHINISGLNPQTTEYSLIFRIPLERTGGKRILSALSIDLPYSGNGLGGLAGAVSGPMSTMTTNLVLSGINTVEVKDNISLTNIFLRCKLGDEPNFMDWDARSIQGLGEFANLACKMVCYKRLSIAMGDGSINGGTINSYLRQHLDEMSDSHTQYNELMRTTGRKKALYKDPVTRRRMTNMIMPTFF